MNGKLHELPVEERIRIVEDLWDSIAGDQNALGLTTEQKTEELYATAFFTPFPGILLGRMGMVLSV
ncbi:MAG: addiction module protein [Candidatus Ozemobacteraceae bacterium]